MFETLYFASLKTEEAQSILCHIVYLDPKDPENRISAPAAMDRWSSIALSVPIPFTVASLVKIAKASDPRTSSFAVYPDADGKLSIWGLVDQGNRYHEFINFDNERAPERPGLFQASIIGIGHVIAYEGYARIAELNVDTLIRESHDVLRYGPVRAKLQNAIDQFHSAVVQERTTNHDWGPRLTEEWIATLCRLLLRMRNYRHGGALLITPDNIENGLNVKYRIDYPRLRQALHHRGTSLAQRLSASIEVVSGVQHTATDPTLTSVPAKAYFDEIYAQENLSESASELDGAIWFVSLLSRVDGLVLLNPHLEVKGFGVEILKDQAPPRVLRSTTATATERSLQPADYQHWGTRHRSMMRYCYSVPESIGFVISQDGEVRVMTSVHGDLVVWESIRLQLDEFIRRGPSALPEASPTRSRLTPPPPAG